MRLFKRSRDTKTSVIRREGVSATAEAAASTSPVARVVESVSRIPVAPTSSTQVVGSSDREDSDVFVCADPNAKRGTAGEVTLFVHGWHNVEPGLLSWTFPSLRAALDAVQRMKNAIGWCVVSGTGWRDLTAARTGGAVLVEQLS